MINKMLFSVEFIKEMSKLKTENYELYVKNLGIFFGFLGLCLIVLAILIVAFHFHEKRSKKHD